MPWECLHRAQGTHWKQGRPGGKEGVPGRGQLAAADVEGAVEAVGILEGAHVIMDGQPFGQSASGEAVVVFVLQEAAAGGKIARCSGETAG